MKCRKCHGECNNVRWASVYCNGVYMSVGGIASNLASKHDYAIAMANGETFHKYDSEDDIQVLEYNHCFLCGYSNYSTRVKYKRRRVIMTKYTLQYSRPNDTRTAASDWLEYETVITGANRQAAIKKWQDKLEGTALILDCYETREVNNNV